MKKTLLVLALVSTPLACGPPPPPPPVTPTPPSTAVEAPTMAPAAVDTGTPAPAEPTPEEKKKAADARQLAADRAQMEIDTKAETARWTPELHAEAKALAGAKYPNLKAALGAAMKSKVRKPLNPPRDTYRHPVEMLTFFGLTPSMTVLEWGPGEGWFTELLAPTLATSGKLIVSTTDPAGPPDARSTFYGEREKRFLDMSPELYGKVDRLVVAGDAPKLGMDGKLDMVLVFRGLHGMHQHKLVPGFLAEVFKALKPGGVLGIEQHRAAVGANPDDSAKKGYLPEAWVIQQAEAAGFKSAGKSEVNANPKDTKDYAEGVWVLPPTYQLKDKDHQKYADIGESDRMTLKFIKPKK